MREEKLDQQHPNSMRTKRVFWTGVIASCGIWLALCAQAFSEDERYIVRFRSTGKRLLTNDQLLSASRAALGDYALQDIDRLPHDNSVVVRLRSEDARAVAARREVSDLELDGSWRALRETNDPLLTEQYALQGGASSNVCQAWDVTTGSARALVAVIDSGVDLHHPDLQGAIWRNPKEVAGNGRDDDRNGFTDDTQGYDFVHKDNLPQDDNGHGTHVAGIVAAAGDNALGVVGVAWGTKIIPIKALDAQGAAFVSTIVKAIDYITDLKRAGAPISVINLSLGGEVYSSSLYRAVERARNHDILLVAAAGNDGLDNDIIPLYPASFAIDSVVSVAATDESGAHASFSNYGATSVHVAAPGSKIISTAWRDSGVEYRLLSGTSMASPHAAGVLALTAAANPQLSMLQVRSILLATVLPVDSLQGRAATGGRVDAFAAVERAVLAAPLARIFGYVKDGARVLSGVRLSLASLQDSSIRYATTSAKDGSYSISELPEGDYRFSARGGGNKFASIRINIAAPRAKQVTMLARR